MTASTPTSLRNQVIRGGVYLGARQLIGMGVSVVGALVLMKVLGPSEYGLYAAAIGFFTMLQLVAQLGVGVFLVRREGTLETETAHQASTLLALLGSAGFLVGLATLPLLTALSRLEGVALPTLALYAALPLVALSQVPMAILDRRLDYPGVAWTELAGQIVFFLVSIGVALARPTVWAPVIGWWGQQLVLLAGASYRASYRPRVAWDSRSTKEMLRYGLGFSVAVWLYQLRRAVNAVVVGRYLGSEGVAVVSLAFQLVVQLSFITVSTWRLSTAALARVQSEPVRLLRAIEEGMRLQIPASAPPLLLFAWLAPSIVPLLLGPEWGRLPEIFPFVAAAFLFNAVFTMQASALFVLRKNRDMVVAHAAQLGLLAATSLVAIPVVGLAGWGFAELASVGAYLLMHTATVRAIGRPRYEKTLLLAAAAATAMFPHQIGIVAVLPLALLSLVTRPWRDVSIALRSLRAARS